MTYQELIAKVLAFILTLASTQQQPTPEQFVAELAETLEVQISPDTVYITDTVFVEVQPPSTPVTPPTPPDTLSQPEIVLEGITDTLTGTVFIQAIPSAPGQVVFNLSGPISDTWTENIAPYFWKGDSNGKAAGWNTVGLPDGAYTLTATSGGASATESFVISNAVRDLPPTYQPPTPPTTNPPATTPTPNENLFFTKQEVAIWRTRAQSGPYKVKGDVRPNSPGDWQLIVDGKNRFLANPDADNWYGPTGSGLVQKWATPESKNKSRFLVMAAFYALITNDQSVASNVKTNILKMIRTKRIDFSDRSQWSDNLETINPGFFVPDWALRIAHSYYYTQGQFTAAERQEVERYLQNVAEWSYITINAVLRKNWSNRAAGIPAGSYQNPTHVDYTGKGRLTWDGGYKVPIFTQYTYNNRSWMFERYLAWAGCQFGNEKWKNEAEMFFKEWIQYGVYPDGTMGELYRGQGGYAWSPGNTGYYYSGIVLASAIATADYFWRSGDASLYEYTFTGDLFGEYNKMVGKGPRNLKKAITAFCSYHTTDQTKRVGGQPLTGHWNGNKDGYVIADFAALANRYYNDPFIRQAYLRTHPQAIGYPGKVASMAGNNGYGGPLGTYPGPALMYNQTETTWR